jgi:NPCBM/NEW2 domain-containing protein
LMTGLSKPKLLRVDQLGQARRMILSVQDGGDGNRNDLADWVDGKLFLKRE